jgi:hypothetical protein
LREISYSEEKLYLNLHQHYFFASAAGAAPALPGSALPGSAFSSA